MTKASDILAFTVSHGPRRFFREKAPLLRGTAGTWFDWAVWLGAPDPEAREDAESLLREDPSVIQRLKIWDHNRGQHHGFAEALALARDMNYEWLLRLDDDVTPKTKRWLKHMLDQIQELRRRAKDDRHRIVASPTIKGLRNPLKPVGQIRKGQKFDAEAMEVLGGACRLHPVKFLSEFKPDLYLPLGRGDPESMASYVFAHDGFLVRLKGIRMQHHTDSLEENEDEECQRLRRIGWYWPYLGGEDVQDCAG